MERIAVDVLGPLPETHAGNRVILVVGDYGTNTSTPAYSAAVPISAEQN